MHAFSLCLKYEISTNSPEPTGIVRRAAGSSSGRPPRGDTASGRASRAATRPRDSKYRFKNRLDVLVTGSRDIRRRTYASVCLRARRRRRPVMNGLGAVLLTAVSGRVRAPASADDRSRGHPPVSRAGGGGRWACRRVRGFGQVSGTSSGCAGPRSKG